MAGKIDIERYYNWANDPLVRQFSYNQQEIVFSDHEAWFNAKVNDSNAKLYLFISGGDFCGQVRIEYKQQQCVIGISVDKAFRGKKLAAYMLKQACGHYLTLYAERKIVAFIKAGNQASLRSFLEAGFAQIENELVNNVESYKLVLRNEF